MIALEKEKHRKLNLTVSPDKRQMAAKLAQIENRSISNLFEALIEAEWARIRANSVPVSTRA